MLYQQSLQRAGRRFSMMTVDAELSCKLAVVNQMSVAVYQPVVVSVYAVSRCKLYPLAIASPCVTVLLWQARSKFLFVSPQLSWSAFCSSAWIDRPERGQL